MAVNTILICFIYICICIAQATNVNTSSPVSHNQIVEIKCTSNCVCDHFRALRRATCNDKRMVAIKDNMPRKTQILEFSYNYVTKIENNAFHANDLSGLKVLNVSHNRIGEIDIFAFEPIKELEILDLSFNALQYVLPEWFWEFTALKEVHLHHNNLGALKDAPIFNSQTLQFLDLSNCLLPHLYDYLLDEIPNLERLDVSNNYLIGMKITVVEHLQNLEEIKLQNNPIQCDNVQEFLAYLKANLIEHKTDCIEVETVDDVENVETQGTQRKFEKIVNWSGESSDDREEESIETSWIFEETITDQGVEETECPKLHEERKHFLMEIIELSPVITLSSCLGVGFLIGLTFGCACRCKKPVKRRQNIKSMRRVSRSYSFRGGQVQDRQFLIDQ